MAERTSRARAHEQRAHAGDEAISEAESSEGHDATKSTLGSFTELKEEEREYGEPPMPFRCHGRAR
jgi:hypothetical protein